MLDFEVAIINEREDWARLAASIRAVEAELADARADTGPRQAARQQLAALRVRQDSDEKLKRAEAEIKTVLDRWEQRTGRRPAA